MKRKISVLILGAALFISPAYADSVKPFYSQNGALIIESGQDAVVSCYDDSGRLVYSNIYPSADNKVKIFLPEKYLDMEKRVYISGSEGVFRLEEEYPSPSAQPSASPEATPEASSEKPPYPSIYPRETDAINAFAVCERVLITQNSDNEDAYLIEAFYQGQKTEFIVPANVNIASAPLKNYYLNGQDASALKKGDVFKLTYNLSKTRIQRIDFLFRPDIKNIASDNEDYGENFEKLFSFNGTVGGMTNWTAAKYGRKNSSKYQYAFGIVVDKSKNHISLMNKGGRPDEIMDIDIESGTIVYTCDVSEKYEIKSTDYSGITKTFVPSSLFDNEEIIWTPGYDYSYAFVRIIKGTATDIIVYNNF